MDPAQGRAVMRLSDLRDAKVRTLDGKSLGRVHEVHCEGGRIVALMCGAASFIEELTARDHGTRIAWERVRRIAGGEILIADEPAPSAPRSRQGTPRASARRKAR